MFSRPSPATQALFAWMSAADTHATLADIEQSHADVPGLMAAGPDLEARFKRMRPLAWCMSCLPHSLPLLHAILAQPPNVPGALDPHSPIQDVLDAAHAQPRTEHVPRALCAVLAWSQNIPPPGSSSNSDLLVRSLSLHPEVDASLLEKLRLAGYDPDEAGYRGYTALHAAIANHANPAALAWCLAHCDPTITDKSARTALALAIEMGKPRSVLALLEHGSSPHHASVARALENPVGLADGVLSKIQQILQAASSKAGMDEATPTPSSAGKQHRL